MDGGLRVQVVDEPARGADGPGGPAVVLVHGSLDRAQSFGRTRRRLEDLHVVAYDRRGYGASRPGGTTTLDGHVDDLLAVAELAGGGAPVAAVGHSFGGDVVVAAALAEPARFAAVGAYEPPMPWLGFRRDGRPAEMPPPVVDPGAEAEAFFVRMVGEAAWARLPETARAERRADGAALVEDLRAFRGDPPFDVLAIRVRAVFGRGSRSTAHHTESVAWLAEHVPGATRFDIEGAQHGAHLTHPDHFAALVRAVVRSGSPAAQVEAQESVTP